MDLYFDSLAQSAWLPQETVSFDIDISLTVNATKLKVEFPKQHRRTDQQLSPRETSIRKISSEASFGVNNEHADLCTYFIPTHILAPRPNGTKYLASRACSAGGPSHLSGKNS